MSFPAQKHGVGRGKLLQSVLASLGSSSPGTVRTEPASPTIDAPSSLCICNRKIQDILCRSCGHVFSGRVRKKCVLHMNEIHLMDASCCPKCKTTYLLEFGVNKFAEDEHQKQLAEMAIKDSQDDDSAPEDKVRVSRNLFQKSYDIRGNCNNSSEISEQIIKEIRRSLHHHDHNDGPKVLIDEHEFVRENWDHEIGVEKRE